MKKNNNKNNIEENFQKSKFSISEKLQNFSKYVSRRNITSFLVKHELFKMQLNIKGSIIECGVHQAGGVFTWAKLSSIYEPYNYHRKIIGFDTFKGFPSVKKDKDKSSNAYKGNFKTKIDSYKDIIQNIKFFNQERALGNVDKIELVKGDACDTIPKYLKKNSHLIISLLYLDFDIYDPTKTALEFFFDRIPKGGVIAFDELNNQDWPGETMALIESIGLKKHKIQQFSYDPNISYIIK